MKKGFVVDSQMIEHRPSDSLACKLQQWTQLLQNRFFQAPNVTSLPQGRNNRPKLLAAKSAFRSVERMPIEPEVDMKKPIIFNSGIQDSMISGYSADFSDENCKSDLKVIFAKNRETSLNQSIILQVSDPNHLKKSKSTISKVIVSPKVFNKPELNQLTSNKLIPTPRSERSAKQSRPVTLVSFLPKSTMATVLDLSAAGDAPIRETPNSAEKTRELPQKPQNQPKPKEKGRSRSPLINILGFDSPMSQTQKKNIRRIPVQKTAGISTEYYLRSHKDSRRFSAECNESSDGRSSAQLSRIWQQTVDSKPLVKTDRLKRTTPLMKPVAQTQRREVAENGWKQRLLTRDRSTQTDSDLPELLELQDAYRNLHQEMEQKMALITDLFSKVRQDQHKIQELEQLLSRVQSSNRLEDLEEQEQQIRFELYNPKSQRMSAKDRVEKNPSSKTPALNKSSVAVPGAPLFVSNSNVQISISQPSAAAVPLTSLTSLAELFQDAHVLQEDFEVLCNQLLKESGETFKRFWIDLRGEISNLRQDVAILQHERGLLKTST